MFDQQKFSEILENIISNYDSLRDFSNISGFNRTSVSKYVRRELSNPPSPEILKKISDNSKGLTTYMELMIICGYITNENVEEINRSLKIYEHTRKLKIQLIKQIENVELTNEELAIVKKYVDDKISGYLSKDNIKISIKYIRKCKKIMKELKEINNIPNINNKKVYNYCLNKLLVMTGDMMLFLVDMDISDKYNINYNFDLYENNNDTNVMVAEESIPYPTSNIVKIPVVGTVAAGEPILAEQNIIDYEELPANEFRDGEYFRFENQTEALCILVF